MEWTAEAQENNGVLRVRLSLTHEELAQLIGYSRESVSRSLGEFRRQRLLELNRVDLAGAQQGGTREPGSDFIGKRRGRFSYSSRMKDLIPVDFLFRERAVGEQKGRPPWPARAGSSNLAGPALTPPSA